jgi:hypothetical protein
MESLTLTASAIASLVLTKAAEKLGEQVSSRSMESRKKLLEVMRKKYPDIVEQESKGQLSYREALVQIETAVERDPEVAEAVIELGDAVKSEPNQEIVFRILSNVITHLQEEPRQIYNVQYNFPNGDTRLSEEPNVIIGVERQKLNGNMKKQTYNNNQSKVAGFYFSILSLILVGLLVFVPLTVGIQQVLVALIALFAVVSLSAFKRSARYTES